MIAQLSGPDEDLYPRLLADVNGDQIVDRKDVDLIAMNVVKLDDDQGRGVVR